MSAAWTPAENTLLGQNIDETSSTAKHKLGTIVRAKHATYGAGEFIYLLGVANTVVGSLVTYSASTYQTTLSPTAGESAHAVAVAMAATGASTYGWYQIGGMATVKKTAVAVSPQVAIYLSGTAGRVKVIASEGKGIVGARSANLASVTSTTSTVLVAINRPHLQGFRSA